jgi:flagellar FliL protein
MSDETEVKPKKGKSKDGKPKKSKKKLIIMLLVVLLVGGAGGYKMFLAPKPVPPKLKIEGSVVALEREFVVNLEEGHYGKLSVALVVKPEGDAAAAHAAGEPMVVAQEPVIRAIITDHLTNLTTEDLIDREKRDVVIEEILHTIEETTDEHVTKVYFTDLAIQ